MHASEPTGHPAAGGDGSSDGEVVMDMLADRVPLSLIMDLAMPSGPHSDELLAEEGAPDEPWWEPR